MRIYSFFFFSFFFFFFFSFFHRKSVRESVLPCTRISREWIKKEKIFRSRCSYKSLIGNGRFCTTSFKVLYTLDRAWREEEREILNGYLLRRAYLRLGSCCSVKNCVRSTSGYALTSPGNRFRNHVVTGFSYNEGFIDIANIMRWILDRKLLEGFQILSSAENSAFLFPKI